MLLDLVQQHLLDRILVEEKVPHLGIHLLVDDEVATQLVIAHTHRLRGGHHVLAHRLGNAHQRLLFTLAQLIEEGARDQLFAHIELVEGDLRYLEQHGGDQVHTLDQVHVDVLVEGHLTALLQLALLRGSIHNLAVEAC